MRAIAAVTVLALAACGTPLTLENAANTDDWTICVIRGETDRTGQEHTIADQELARRGVDCRERALLRLQYLPRFQAPVLQHYPIQVPQPAPTRPAPQHTAIGILQGQTTDTSVTGVPLWSCR